MTIRDEIGDPANGNEFISALDERFAAIWNGVVLHMAPVGGTANAVTATVTPAVGIGGYLNGMAFSIVWAAANTISNFTLNGLPVVGPAGEALPVGAVAAGLASVLVVIDDKFRIMSVTAAESETAAYYWQITSSQSVTWPTDLPANRRVRVQAWGGGGGGHASGGAGGGGGYAEYEFRLGTLGASTTCTIGAGGSVGNDGGNTTFGSLLTAYGGGGGAAGYGGSGAGTNAKGGSSGSDTFQGGGKGAKASPDPADGSDATGLYGGGGGNVSGSGYRGVYGGGGGAAGSGSGGSSRYGGNGGASGSAGSAPAGGGGRNAAGARGEIRIWIG